MTFRVYHYNKCSKSRACIKLLEQEKIQFEIREYFKDSLSMDEIDHLIKNLKGETKSLLRIPIPTLKDFNLIKFIFDNQKSLERPILFNGKNYFICRPPTKALEIINE